MARVLIIVWLGLGALAVTATAFARPVEPLEEARLCTEEPGRLARLACFDKVFGTPVTARKESPEPRFNQSANWQLAYAMESARQPDDQVLYRDAGAGGGHVLTIAALGAVPPRPLLMIQCHNNITELAMLLPQSLDSERVRLTFDTGVGRQRQTWRVRDEGLLLSGGRGLPAIGTIKSIAATGQFRPGSDQGAIDGLVFDLTGLSDALKPLRKACGW